MAGMTNYKGYFVKIGDCKFQSPAIKREGYTLNTRIVQVTDNQVTASGKLVIKPLPHKPTKITMEFPVMTVEEFRYYAKAFRGELTNEDEMFLTVEYYDMEKDVYKTGTFYHTDIVPHPVIYDGEFKIVLDTISLVEH